MAKGIIRALRQGRRIPPLPRTTLGFVVTNTSRRAVSSSTNILLLNPRYEKLAFQQEVRKSFEKLIDDSWFRIDATQDPDTISKLIMSKVEGTLKEKESTPLRELW